MLLLKCSSSTVTQGGRCNLEAKVLPQSHEVSAVEGLSENIGRVVTGANTGDRQFPACNEFANVEFYAYVFDSRVEDMVFC
jgi:hypothetical protein